MALFFYQINTMKKHLLSKYFLNSWVVCAFIIFLPNTVNAENKSERKEIVNLISKGIKYWSKQSYDSAHIYLLESERRAVQAQDTQLIVVSLNNMGLLEISRANFENSIEYFQKSLKYNSNKNGSKLNTFLNISKAYRKMGDYDSALIFLYKTKDIAESLQRNKELAESYNEFGIIKKLQKNYEEALFYYQKSLQIGRELDYKKGVVGALNNIGNVYKEQKNFSKALLYFNEALKLKLELGDKKYLASAYLNVGEVQMMLKDFVNAESSLKKSLKYSHDSNDKELEITSCFLLGELFINTNNFLEAEIYLLKAKKQVELIGALDLHKEVLLRLKDFYAAQNNGKQALAYYDKYISIKDSIFNTENMQHMQEMETRYQTREKEQQIEVLNIEKEAKEQESKYMKIILAVFLFSLLPLGFFIKQRQKTRLLQERIAGENRECNRISRDLHDGVASSLSYLCRSMEKENSEQEFAVQLRKISDEVRGISHQLNMTAIGNQKFREALSDSLPLDHFPENIDLKIHLSEDFEIEDYKKKIYIIRIVQELINNSLKHAEASTIIIKFKKENSKLQLEYADDGLGVDLEKICKGNGWHNIHERAEFLSGKLKIESSEGNGFYLKLVV